MTRVLFLRHGESAHNAHTGTETLSEEEGDRLTPRGIEQAHASGEALAGHGVTHLLTSPMRRAVETADAVGAALGLEPAILPYVHELQGGETFGELVARVRQLKAELGSTKPGERPLIVGHGIFTRFFLLDSVLGDAFEPPMAAGIWNLGSCNCGLSVFTHGEARDPAGAEVPGWTCLSWMQRPWDPP